MQLVHWPAANIIALDLSSLGAGNDQGFSYFEENNASSALAALVDLDNYFNSEGPFDGIIAFSQSVGLAGTWLVHRQRRQLPSVRCGVFFSGAATALDPDILHDGRMVALPADRVGQVIDTPTAHIYGSEDSYAAAAKEFSGICNSAVRSTYIHPGRHEVPGSGSGSSAKDVVHLSVNAIRRVISLSAE